ncbi:CRTAC1 family protein [Haloechinothrix salitolerans]|uniref:CRTAC1 family protein n=1 Tax=Haloechinothrix salitolerans TaxID=926830 RepID=A0ABW2BW31_9PSEU
MAFSLFTIRPDVGAAEARRMAERFDFTVERVNSEPDGAAKERSVAPAVERIRSWISAVGAATAVFDLRESGFPADVCLVDPRDDSVTVRPVPGDGGAYDPVRLSPDGLRYDDTMAPMGCVPADLDEDGDRDLLVYYWGRSPVLFLNTATEPGPPTARTFRAVELIEPMEVWNSTGLNVGDVDGDGHLDVLVANYFPDGARVLDPTATEESRMAMQDSMALARNAGTNRVLLTTPSGEPDTKPALVDHSNALPAHAASAWTLAMGLQDLTGDALPELYQANDFGPDQLLVNRSTPGDVRLVEVTGERDLTTPKSQVLGHDSFKGMGVTFTYQGDAELPAIMVSNITTPYALHESNLAFVPDGDPAELLDGTLPYDERSEELGIARGGWCWDIKAGDFDNDGVDEVMQANGFLEGDVDRWPLLQELAMGNDDLLRYPEVWPEFGPEDDLSGHESNPLWVADADGRYTDLAAEVGIAAPYNSRGFGFGDVDGDGSLDVVVANQWEDSVLLRNEVPADDAAHVRVVRESVTGSGTGKVDVIGARIELRHPDRPQRRQLYPANGHAGVSASELHFVLPGGEPAPAVVSWRDADGKHSARVELRPGHRTVTVDDSGTAVVR